MEESKPNAVDPRNGFHAQTMTFHSLRPPLRLPPPTLPLSAAHYALSLRQTSPWPDSPALIDAATAHHFLYSDFTRRVRTLAANLRSPPFGIARGDVAFLLSPNLIQVPILNFALLSIGAVVSPGNPNATAPEIGDLLGLCKAKFAFTTAATAGKLDDERRISRTIVIDSPEFESMMRKKSVSSPEQSEVRVEQSDVAAIMYSSGTTGKVKGVMITHRNLIAAVAVFHANTTMARDSPPVMLYTMPYFHVYGFFYAMKSVAVSDVVVVMSGRFSLGKMLRAVEEFSVTKALLVPPIVVALVKSELPVEYDLSSLEEVGCGAAPLGRDVILAFVAKFPSVALSQGYGLTETTGGVCRTGTPEECQRWGTTGRLLESIEARIVDPVTGLALPPGKPGELWVRGPTIMKGKNA